MSEKQVEITRVFDAPRDMVFQAWTTAEHLAHWFAPNGCRLTVKEIDCRTGGTFLTCVHAPNGFDCWCTGEYKEVAAPDRLVYNIAVCDEQGNRVTSEASGHDAEWPEETVVTVTFRDAGDGRTEMTLHQNVSEALAQKTGAYPSWLEMLDRLALRLSNQQ